MADTFQIVAGHLGHVAVFHLDAEECRGIADALGHHDAGAQEMLRAAEAIEDADGGEF